MENEEVSGPSSGQQAREALALAGQAEESMRRPVLPGWFFPVMALLVGVLLASQVLGSAKRGTVMAGIVVVALLANGLAQRQSGVSWATHRLRGQVPFLIAVLAVIVATAVAVAITELAWIWAVGAVVAAGVVAVTGVVYRRAARR